MTGPLLIDGNLPLARLSADGQEALRATRRALVTGGRSLLTYIPGKPFRLVGEDEIIVFSICLAPEIERRLRVSGGTLSEEEIRAGLEQIREDDEDVEKRLQVELEQAFVAGQQYAMSQMWNAINYGDERALHRAWETARKTMTLRRQINAAGPVVEGQSAPGQPLDTNPTGASPTPTEGHH